MLLSIVSITHDLFDVHLSNIARMQQLYVSNRLYPTLRSINAKDFGKPGVWCIVSDLGLHWVDTSDMAVRKSLDISQYDLDWLSVLFCWARL